MAGVKGKSGLPGNMNSFRHGPAGISQRGTSGVLTADEQDIRASILAGLIQDNGGEQQTSTAMRILAEVIASDAAWLAAFNEATDAVMEKNQKARENPKALATLDGYKRGLVNSLTGNLQRFGFEKVAKVESLQEIIDEMSDDPGTGDKSSPEDLRRHKTKMTVFDRPDSRRYAVAWGRGYCGPASCHKFSTCPTAI